VIRRHPRARGARAAESAASDAPRPATDPDEVRAEHAAHGDEAHRAEVVADEDRRGHGEDPHVDEHGPGEHGPGEHGPGEHGEGSDR
jgi:hypothetical protein